MTILDAYGSDRFGLSFELFPPKTEAKELELADVVAELAGFRPDYMTCTYGAGGSTRDKTLQIISSVKQKVGCPVASHLTCVGSTRDQLRGYLNECRDLGIDYIVALRGDPPQGEKEFKPTPGGLTYACDLVEMIQAEYPEFGIAVAGYPEKHREAVSAEADLENLKRKVAAGGQVVITQLFYDNADFFRFREQYERAGIDAPLVPGLLPITNFAQIKRITALCGARLPDDMLKGLEAAGDDAEAQFEVGVGFAIQQARELLANDVPGMHFYVLNQARATKQLLPELNLPRPTVA
jgi:methylenetetrahydrofolate reductase (NADPH)